MAQKGVLYMIPCPISDSTEVFDVVPEANRRIMDSLDYFIVENVRSARRFLSKARVSRRIEELEFVELNENAELKSESFGYCGGLFIEEQFVDCFWNGYEGRE